jgi:lambda repressor-like predicted transcriptional regulator
MTLSVSRFAPVIVAAAFVLCHVASAAAATARPDSAAPAGATASWLPAEDWVMQRWMPFDERALTKRLGMSSEDIAAELDRTGISLQTLARRRGVRVQGLAGRLLASRHLPQGSALRTTLLERTRSMLTQSHLTVHMLRHVFHTWTVTRETEAIFGVSQERFAALYFDQHRSMGEIAADGGVSTATLRRRALAAAERAGRMGVAAGALSTSENRVLRARDRRRFRGWELYRVPVTAGTARAGQRAFACHLATR